MVWSSDRVAGTIRAGLWRTKRVELSMILLLLYYNVKERVRDYVQIFTDNAQSRAKNFKP